METAKEILLKQKVNLNEDQFALVVKAMKEYAEKVAISSLEDASKSIKGPTLSLSIKIRRQIVSTQIVCL